MIPLHTYSNYSMLRGTIPVEGLVRKGVEYNLPTMALTDINGMYGLVRFTKAAVQSNIKPIYGSFINDHGNDKLNAVVIAKNNSGYSELCKLITVRKLNDDFSLAGVLNRRSDNLIIITSSEELLLNLNDFRNVFAELISADGYKKRSRKLFELSRIKNIPVVAAAPAAFLTEEDYYLHQVVTAIRLNTTIENIPPEELIDKEFYFKNPREEAVKWKSIPEAVENTYRIAEQCNVDIELGKYKFPEFDLPPGNSTHNYLTGIAFEGLYKRYSPVPPEAVTRLEKELDVIWEMNFSNYFLVVWDIVKEANKRGMMIIGRGSAANSLVAYCLFFTQVDPIKHNFYFERFMNRGRSSPPDVDIDFSWRERDEIVKYIFDKYGYENVAMISTTITFRARSAFRETAKVFGFSDSEISKYSKFIPWTNARNLPNVSELFPEAKSLDFTKEPWNRIIKIAARLADYPRHLSIHPSGIIITPKPIVNYTALEYAKNKGLGLIITQPDMYSIEDLGLIKIDLLSQRSLGVLRDTMERLKEEE